MSKESATTEEQLRRATAQLREFNERSDVALETVQPLLQQYVALLRTLQTEVVQLNSRAMRCVDRARSIAQGEGVDISALKLGQHDEELVREEHSEYAKKQ